MTDQSGLRLRVEFGRSNGGWCQPFPKIEDGKHTFSIDPNKPNELRIHPSEHPPFMQFDMDRLKLIHRLLLEARDYATVGNGSVPA